MHEPDQKLNFLDHLRGVAIMLVFAYHALVVSYGVGQLNWDGWHRDFHHSSAGFLLLTPLTFGWGGVAIFFVVSGFCIHLSHERAKNKSLKIFFARRFFRIYPPYLIALIFFAFFLPSTRLGFHSLHNAAQFFSHLFLVHNLGQSTFSGICPSFWSIAIEAQLYLLYPLLLWLARGSGWTKALLLAGVIEIGLRLAAGFGEGLPRWVISSPLAYWLGWSIGACLADQFLKGQPLILGKLPLWIWPGFAIVFFLVKPLYPLCFLAIALFTASLIARLAHPNHPGFFRQNCPPWLEHVSRHVRWVGTISYSIYLLHQPFTWLVARFYIKFFPAQPVHPLVIFASFLVEWPLILLLSYGFYRWVEQPSINLGKWFIREKLSANAGKVRLPVSSA